PVPVDVASFPNTEPGYTRLVDAQNLARELGLRKLWVKDDSGNPTHSFKDRVVASALSATRELGMTVFACPSTGNLANAVAASGSQLTKIDKGFTELGKLGLVDATDYKVYGAQATGCSPVAQAFRDGHDVVKPVRPNTIAKSLAIGNPADGPYVLDVARRTGGCVADVGDPEVISAMRLLAATEGIFGETAAGVTLGVLRRLLADGPLDPGAETVIINSGDGLKTLDALADGAPAAGA